MKIAVGMFKHETNTFSPVPTRWQDFGPGGPLFGAEAYKTFRHSGYSMAGLLEQAEAMEAEIFVPVAARALPSAPVDRDAFERISDTLCTAARQCDAMMLDIHGAMVAEHYDDGEGELLARLRSTAPGLPIALALDSHANITQRMIDNCTVMPGYRTYPHLDMVETGRLAGRLLRDTLAGRLTPATAMARVPMLPNMLRAVTSEQPMAQLIAAAAEAERDGMPCVTVFSGFPLSDTPDSVLSVVATANGDREAAAAVARRIGDLAWSLREQFTSTFEPLGDALARAKAVPGGPVILADLSDNCHSGGTQDSMDVIEAALDKGLEGILAGPVVDRDAVAQMVEAGVGATLTLAIGARTPIPALKASLRPLRLTGRVRSISDGRFTVEGPVFTGMQVNLGRTVVFDTGPLVLVVSEDRVEALDPQQFRLFGLEPTRFRYLVLKSKVQYRPAFMPLAKAAIECNGAGVANLDLDSFEWRKLRRPTFPLDRSNA
jgi:microcystin degradation protein MlrC